MAPSMAEVSSLSHGSGTISGRDTAVPVHQNRPPKWTSFGDFRPLDGSTQSTASTGQTVSAQASVLVIPVIDTTPSGGGELTDTQIKYLHHQQGWSPTRIAESRGVRGRKQVRLDRVYAALGIPRDHRAEVER